MVKKLLHLEGFIFFLTSLFFYLQLQGNWLTFILLLFTPDLSMVGYLKDKKLGAVLYNLMHNYISALVLIAGGMLIKNTFIMQLGIILFAHVAIDRALGYGLKYPTNFKDTHLQKV